MSIRESDHIRPRRGKPRAMDTICQCAKAFCRGNTGRNGSRKHKLRKLTAARFRCRGSDLPAATDFKEETMRRIALIAVGLAVIAGVAAYIGSASGQSDESVAPIYGIRIPDGYRDWHLI